MPVVKTRITNKGPVTVNASEFARIIGKSPRWVTNLIAEGMPIAEAPDVKGRRAVIDTAAAIEWIIKRSTSRHEAPPRQAPAFDSESMSRAEADRQGAIEKFLLQQIERQQKTAELVELADVDRAFAHSCVEMRKNTDAIAGRLATTLANISDPAEIRGLLLSECRSASDAAANEIEAFLEAQSQIATDARAAIAPGVGVGGGETEAPEG